MGFGAGKVILLGEHGVVYGYPAIAAGLALGVEATAKRSSEHRLRIDSWSLNLPADPDSEEPLSRAFAMCLDDREPLPHPIEVACEVNLPPGAGLGCSAAIGVATLRALDEILNTQSSPEQLQERSLRWEKFFHGTPSGIDNAVSAFGGIVRYTRGSGVRRMSCPSALSLVIAHSGASSSTKDMVESVQRQQRHEPQKVAKVFQAIATLVQNAEHTMASGNLRHLGQLMTLNQSLLATLMLSTGKIEELCEIARDAGALGAKLTGAGGGGCIIALCEDSDQAFSVAEALHEKSESVFMSEVSS